MEGWIKLYRSTLENPIVCKDSDHLAIWAYLLMKATHKGYDVVFGGKRITLQPGQLITGRREISRTLSLHESKVQRVLTRFKNEHQIEQRANNQNRLVSIINWNKYQNAEQQGEHPSNNERTSSEHQANTNKNVEEGEEGKECKQEKKKSKRLSHLTDDELGEWKEVWFDFLDHKQEINRQKEQKYFKSEKSERTGLNQLKKKSKNDIETAKKIVEQSRANGWKGLFELQYDDKKKKTYGNMFGI